jgi:hypothetical protein
MLLFGSIDSKFPARRPGLFLQGAWIVFVLCIKHSERALLDAFAKMNPSSSTLQSSRLLNAMRTS